MKKYLMPLLLLFVSLQSFAQYTVTGRIINKDDKKPIANAVVFLNNSSRESTTDSAGRFKLTAPIGQYHLLVSIVGYENYKTTLVLKGITVLNDIELTPKNNTLNEVTIKAKPNLSPCFPNFEVEFFGNTMFARQCKILNPLVLQFYDITPKGGFSARSSDFIQVENDALGYKIKFLLLYFIKDADKQTCYFNGESFFEEMHGTPPQEKEWRKNRLECYQGSTMQLLRAVLSDSLAQNGFKVKRDNRKHNEYFNKNGFVADEFDPSSGMIDLGGDNVFDFTENTRFNDKIENGELTGKNLLLHTNQKGLYAITAKSVKDTSLNSLYIEHARNTIPVANGEPTTIPWIWGSNITIVTFDKPYLVFNADGKMLNAGIISMDGYMIRQTRVATMLPFDYTPIQ